MAKHQIEPFITHLIEEKERKLLNFLSKWKMFPARNSIKIQKYDGDWINIEGVQFEGSVRIVYWYFFPPFIKNYIVEIMKQAAEHCEAKGMSLHKANKICVAMLDVFISRFYEKLAEVDSNLMGVGLQNKDRIYLQHKQDLDNFKTFIKEQAGTYFCCKRNLLKTFFKIIWDIIKWLVPSGLIVTLIYKLLLRHS